jgi:hypothetical protein
MAADLAPASYSSWIFEKETKTVGGSPQSTQSSEAFFDADEKLRIQPSMADIRSILHEETEPFMDQEYQSSEEALSPMVDDIDLSEDEQDMEAAEDADDEEHELWDNIKFFNLDMAIAICIIAVGQPKMVNLGHFSNRYSRPSRTDSLPPNIPVRSRDRVPSWRLQTNFSNSSLRNFESDLPSSTEESPDQSPMDTSYAQKRHGSIFSIAQPDISSTWTPPLSENERENESEESSSPQSPPSFLQTDPFESTRSPKTGHSRLRSLSSKFSLFNSNKQEAKTDELKKLTKKERRNSLFRPLTPQSIGRRSSEEEERNNVRPGTPQSAFIAPLHPNPRQSTFTRNRMVARAANEREPAIVLPPCPDDYDDLDEPVQLLRSQNFVPRKRKGTQDHLRRRKSLLSLVS